MKRCLSLFLVATFGIYSHVAFSQNIKVNQLIYFTGGNKLAVVPGAETGSFTINDASTNAVVFTGTLGNAQTWAPSGESIRIADFTNFKIPGNYYVKTTSNTSYNFEIKDFGGYHDVSIWSAKAFYTLRASTSITASYATIGGQSYARSAGHLDNVVKIHSSAASTIRPAGTIVSAPKGWYDAGDYNLYVVNAGMSVHSMMMAYEMIPQYFDTLNLNIPESNNGVPDILDELKWEYDWLINMQDPNDGGVYFKLTSLSFCGFVMPQADTLSRYMVGKSTTSALDFAAMMAMGYRVFTKYNTQFPGFADKCLAASRSAWAWAKANPSIAFTNPTGVYTGGYGDNTFTDEFFWAAAELYISTGENAFYNELNFNITYAAPSWADVSGLGLMSLKLHVNELTSIANKTSINSKFQTFVDGIYTIYNNSAYKVPIANFYWGSTGVVASHGTVMALAYYTLKNKNYLDGMTAGMDYILGRNATGYSFMTWFGDKTPQNIHHRQSGSDGIAKPLPGYISGGPCTDAVTDCGAASYPTTTYKARCYVDKQCSYSTNEIAINWNAPFVTLAAATEYAYTPAKVDSAVVLATSPGSIIVYLNKELNQASITNLTNFTVTSDGSPVPISTITINSTDQKIVTITLSSNIEANNSVALSYKGNELTTTLSNTPVASFNGFVVTNYISGTKQSQKISLYQGWNLVSFYIQPEDNSLSNVFSPILSKLQIVKTNEAFYDASQASGLNSLTTIDGGKGYLVKVSADTSLTIQGDYLSSYTYNLSAGWNLIGYPKKVSSNTQTAFTSIWSIFNTLKNFEYFYIKNNTLSSLTTLTTGSGYMLKTTQAGTFVYP